MVLMRGNVCLSFPRMLQLEIAAPTPSQMYAGRHHSKPHGTLLAPRPGKPGMKLAQDPKAYPYAFIAHVGLEAADMMRMRRRETSCRRGSVRHFGAMAE